MYSWKISRKNRRGWTPRVHRIGKRSVIHFENLIYDHNQDRPQRNRDQEHDADAYQKNHKIMAFVPFIIDTIEYAFGIYVILPAEV